MSFKVVVLDFDGVIVDSVGIKDDAFRALFADRPDELDAIMSYHRANNATIRFEKFKFITENILRQPFSETAQEKLNVRYSQFVVEKIIACPFIEGAPDFLEHFSKRSSLYLASINPKEELAGILKARELGKYFKSVYAHPWPKADALRDILQKENIAACDAVFIGDSPEDHAAAVSAGIHFIGRDDGKRFTGLPVRCYQSLNEVRKHMETIVSESSAGKMR